MYLASLKLQNFRNYEKLAVRFSNQATVLVGANAAGKTNLLEAIRFLSLFKSWRAAKSGDLIKWTARVARVEGEVRDAGPVQKIAASLQQENKQLPTKRLTSLNGARVPTRSAVGTFLTVLFSPDDTWLVAAPPRERRYYLDVVLGQIFPRYFESLQRYQAALEQRNFLLLGLSPDQVARREAEIWEAQMAVEGSRIIKERSVFIGALNQKLSSDYQEIGGHGAGALKIIYQPALSQPGVETLIADTQLASLLRNNWSKTWSRDQATRQTNLGPHRDNFYFELDQRPLEPSGSRGEWRSAVLALKLGEKRFIEQQTSQTPVLLLDDVFSELDGFRRTALARRIKEAQCFLTTTDLDRIDDEFKAQAKILKIRRGQIELHNE